MRPNMPLRLDGTAFAIGILSLTACVFFIGFLLVAQPPAYAIGMNDRSGDYVLVTQQLSSSTEGIVVIDAATKQMIFYYFDYNNKTLEMVRRMSLDELPKPRDRSTPAMPERRRRTP